MFEIWKQKTLEWKKNVAGEYIDNLLEKDTDWILKQTNDFLWLLKEDVDKENNITKKVKNKLQDFLISTWLFSDFKWLVSRQLLSTEIQEKLEKAKEILKDSINEQEAREKLWLNWTLINAMEEEKTEKEINNDKIKEKTENLENFAVSEKYIIKQAKKYWVKNPKQIAYILATVKWESNFKNIKEIGWETKQYWKFGYYGRGYVQLTHKYNYEKFTKIIENKKLKFKDNRWMDLNSNDLNLVQNPDTILKSNDLASFILIHWMKEWLFTWKKLSDFINKKETNFFNARSIVNWMSSSPEKFANWAKEYFSKIENKKNHEKLEYSETLLLWDSHVWWLKMWWYKWDKKHFDGYDTEQLYNELKQWNINLSWKKNLILYTGSNDITKDKINKIENNLWEIKKYLDEKNISLVLTKIPYNKSKKQEKIDEVNNILENFSKKNNIKLLDLNTGIKISENEYAWDGIHLNNIWYQKINWKIDSYMV